jgi:hypothetical protein
MDVTPTIAANSDQLNADDLIGGPITVTITRVARGKADQPLDVSVAETDRVWRPCKTVRRVLVAAWGADATTWPGGRVTLYRDPTVTWAGEPVGGIRVSHISGITGPMKVALAVKRGKRTVHAIEPLPDDPHAALRAEWATATPERRAEIEAQVKA